MFFLFLIILIVVVIAAAVSSGSGNSNGAGSYHGGYMQGYDDDFEDYETRAAMGERDYFTVDLARDYDSYYAQVSDAADMGEQDAIDEMYGEFGDGEW